MKFNELPGSIRLRLSNESEEELWSRVDDRGGVKRFAERHGFRAADLYNWRNKDVFLPAGLVKKLFEERPSIEAYKGGGRSRPVENPEFPVPEDPELLTRVESSVYVNREGVPVYTARERSLVERFRQLLSRLGDVPVTVYSRDRYELRYPKYLHGILDEMGHSPAFEARFDEEGTVEDGKLYAGGRTVKADHFAGTLYSRDRRLELALEKGDSEKVRELISEETGRIQNLF